MGRLSIFFAGDFCSKPSTSIIRVSDELMHLIRLCDFKVVNFEVPLKPPVKLPAQKRERFFQNDDAPDFLRGIGFNLFSQANNHAFDWGDEGFIKTKSALGDAAFGAGSYDEAYMPKIVEMNGVKVGFLGLSFAAYKGVFDDVTNHAGLGCAYVNDLKVNHVIIETKKSVDYLFILPHDGIEYIDVPMPETIARYRDFIDYGADGVIASHPHCPQGWEEYKHKPIFYSLGNFFFNSKDTPDYKTPLPHWYEGLCVMITIDGGKVAWEVVNTRNMDNTGIVIDYDEDRGMHNNKICSYLSDKREYNRYFQKVLKELGAKELSIINDSFHPRSLKQIIQPFGKYLSSKFKKQGTKQYHFPLQRLLTHDSRRYLLIRAIKNKA